jgi:gas vesicle protein
MDGNDWKALAPVFLVGLGVGAAIGVMFAPKSGEETMKQISGAVDNVSGAVREGVDDLMTQGKKMGRRAQRTIENARETVRDAAEAGEAAFREVKNQVS